MELLLGAAYVTIGASLATAFIYVRIKDGESINWRYALASVVLLVVWPVIVLAGVWVFFIEQGSKK